MHPWVTGILPDGTTMTRNKSASIFTFRPRCQMTNAMSLFLYAILGLCAAFSTNAQFGVPVAKAPDVPNDLCGWIA